MTPSVSGTPSTATAQSAFALALFDEFARGGMTDVVVCPGSRSTPLVLGALATKGLRLHVRLDERSAGFFAIGRALATRRAVGVVVTSGTAAAELTASVVEADLAGVPLVIVTADRPPELRGVGAPQTIDQVKLFGGSVRRYEDPGTIRPGTERTWRPLAARVLAAARTGPVHLNVPLVEPLDAPAGEVPSGRPGSEPWRTTVDTAVGFVGEPSTPRGRVLVVAGRGTDDVTVRDLAAARGWAVLADPLSGVRCEHPNVVSSFDLVLRDPALRTRLRPDVVVSLGGAPSSKALAESIEEWQAHVVEVGASASTNDPSGIVAEVVEMSPTQWVTAMRSVRGAAKPVDEYVRAWRLADDAVQGELETALSDGLTEPSLARLASRELPIDVALVVSSSMPMRDLEWFGAATSEPRVVFANRGANGIDGVVSTALGVAAGSRSVGLLGDLAFLHDAGALADGVGQHGGTCVLLVVDNDGGGIFSFLAQRTSVETAAFERLFATPPTVDVASVAAGYGATVHAAKDLDGVRSALATGLAADGVTVVVARVPDRDANVELHRVLAGRVGAAARAALER
ncbi:MAG TPA: 2-succinyl-5-enolpyruvyl-6-hydroxy-3-cyclohexene-1-carboxylic-acid synthase [Acidimicrobiales bacterium]